MNTFPTNLSEALWCVFLSGIVLENEKAAIRAVSEKCSSVLLEKTDVSEA